MKGRREILFPSLVLDREAAEPLVRQIVRQIEEAIRAGNLADDARLPSTRTLAQSLRVSRNTVVSAYEELASVGLITARSGSGARVNGGEPPSGRSPAGVRGLVDNPLYVRS
ncbi:MAG TPA: winged helix-turn-helix domain-containing protein [Candidatus Babeliales bacterium]|nr:winged helix-turn-helix domain-containing protein [Candidatus Babeliales bacterium]